jgi:hypothetical protein
MVLDLYRGSERFLAESTGSKRDVAWLSLSTIHCGCDVRPAREKGYREDWDKDSSLDLRGFGT